MPIRVGSALLWGYLAAGLIALGAHAQTAPQLSITLKRVPSNTAGDRSVQVRTEVRNISESNVVLMVAAPQTDFTQNVIGPDGNADGAFPQPFWLEIMSLRPSQSVLQACSQKTILQQRTGIL